MIFRGRESLTLPMHLQRHYCQVSVHIAPTPPDRLSGPPLVLGLVPRLQADKIVDALQGGHAQVCAVLQPVCYAVQSIVDQVGSSG